MKFSIRFLLALTVWFAVLLTCWHFWQAGQADHDRLVEAWVKFGYEGDYPNFTQTMFWAWMTGWCTAIFGGLGFIGYLTDHA